MKAVVLVSGGMDSTTLLHYVVKKLGCREVFALTLDYGQKHRREIDMAEWQCAQLPEVVEWKRVDLSLLGALTQGASALTDAAIEIPDLAALDQQELDQPPTYVPNRNMVMLSVAAAYAESRGCTEIFYGAQAQDEYGYWDCTAGFVEGINQVLALNRRNAVAVRAPFSGKRKSEELAIGLELGVDFAHTWTCYRGGETACGTCPTCVERRKAFAETGIEDPLPYDG